MKKIRINKPVDQSKILLPKNKGGKRPLAKYDNLAVKAKALPKGKSLPVVCDNLAKYRKVYQSPRNRMMKQKQGGLNVEARMGELTIYLSGSGDEKAGIVKNGRSKAKTGAVKKRTGNNKKKATTK